MQAPNFRKSVLNFNSIKVRLELLTIISFLLFFVHFNSIKVRLERSLASSPDSCLWFQFHKGTIRTAIGLAISAIATLFQFHKGTIRTVRWHLTKDCLAYFNSIKVRLELIGSSSGYVGYNEFQFHKGTIRTFCLSPDEPDEPEFQFHKGTIRTCRVKNGKCYWRDFNSIKVRLERKWRTELEPRNRISIP